MAGDTQPTKEGVSIETQLILSQLTGLDKQLSTQLETLDKNVNEMKQDFRKILDDHEKRLRQGAEKDAAQGSEISAIRVQLAELKANVEAIKEDRRAEVARQQSFMQQVIMKLVELAVPSGIVGTLIYLAVSNVGGALW